MVDEVSMIPVENPRAQLIAVVIGTTRRVSTAGAGYAVVGEDEKSWKDKKGRQRETFYMVRYGIRGRIYLTKPQCMEPFEGGRS